MFVCGGFEKQKGEEIIIGSNVSSICLYILGGHPSAWPSLPPGIEILNAAVEKLVSNKSRWTNASVSISTSSIKITDSMVSPLSLQYSLMLKVVRVKITCEVFVGFPWALPDGIATLTYICVHGN